MVASSNGSAPLVVVAGATGRQGGSVVQALLESDREYRLRGLTRDATKPAALKLKEKGVEPIGLNIAVGNEVEVAKAFEGADYVFAMTDFWQSRSLVKEVSEGKLIVDAVKISGATLLWSGLDSYAKNSGGKYTHVDHYEGKAQITEYARERVPTIVIQPAFYALNLTSPGQGPQKQEDGSYAFVTAYREDTLLPVIDIQHDYGIFVRAAIEHCKPGDELLAHSEELTVCDMIKQLAEETGKKIEVKHITDEELVNGLKASGSPDAIVSELSEMVFAQRDFGYFNHRDTGASRKHLARSPRTWRDFVKTADWSAVLN